MKITITPRKPRNLLVAAARFRRAGMHGPQGHAQRQQSGRALKRELEQMTSHSP